MFALKYKASDAIKLVDTFAELSEKGVEGLEEAMVTLTNYPPKVIDKDEKTVFSLDEVSAVTVLGKNKLNVYLDNNKKVYQVKGNKRFNALKYVQFYHHYKNIKAGVENGKFLGL